MEAEKAPIPHRGRTRPPLARRPIDRHSRFVTVAGAVSAVHRFRIGCSARPSAVGRGARLGRCPGATPPPWPPLPDGGSGAPRGNLVDHAGFDHGRLGDNLPNHTPGKNAVTASCFVSPGTMTVTGDETSTLGNSGSINWLRDPRGTSTRSVRSSSRFLGIITLLSLA